MATYRYFRRLLRSNRGLLLVLGIMLGLMYGLSQNAPNCPKCQILHSQNKKLLLVGIMTAKKYLNTRALAAYETWVQKIPGKVLFFCSSGSEHLAPSGLPIIALKGVDDAYPPQRKAFAMLEYMYQHYAREYEWIMRVDDNAYIKGDKLEIFLRSLNSSKLHMIGHAGYGRKSKVDYLHIDMNKPYCMGGPGVIFSVPTLCRVLPFIDICLANTYTTHEDVEVGRCVTHFAKVSCTRASEMRYLFYQNYAALNGSFKKSWDKEETEQAITLHPIKKHTYQYRMHAHIHTKRLGNLWYHTTVLQRQLQKMNAFIHDPSLYKDFNATLHSTFTIAKSRSEVIPWDCIGKSIIYTATSSKPRNAIDAALKTALFRISNQTEEMINRNSKGILGLETKAAYANPSSFRIQLPVNLYRQIYPLHGINYIYDIKVLRRNAKGRTAKERRGKASKRYFILHQSFTYIEFREDTLTQTSQSQQSLDAVQETKGTRSNHDDIVVNFITAISGRFGSFLLFMENFESKILQREKRVTLSVVLFKDETEDHSSYTEIIEKAQDKYPQHTLRIANLYGPFSRSIGLETGSSLHHPDALLVFIDVDVLLQHDILMRIKLNTVQGKQVYFPIMFSQFDPSVYCAMCSEENQITSPKFNYADISGYWRTIGFGMMATYNSDFKNVGGFDKTIQGWGKEDLLMIEAYIRNTYEIFRAPDLGFIHRFHEKHCDTNLPSEQYSMCIRSKSVTFVSLKQLSQIVYKNLYLLHRHDIFADKR